MKLTTANNAEIVIQARNEADFEKALKVAELMCDDGTMSIAAVEECELWVHVCAVWNNGQAKDLRDEYAVAKKQVK